MKLGPRDHGALVRWACDCAGHVLVHFEARYPEDDRPRKALEAGRAWVRGELKMTEAREAAFAARAVGHATATVHVAGHARHAATYAVAAARERDWQSRNVPAHLRPIAFAVRDDD